MMLVSITALVITKRGGLNGPLLLMNKDHIESLIEQIEFGHERSIKCAHSEAKLADLKSLIEEVPKEPLAWADQVNDCKSKKALEKLALDEKGIDLDLRKKLKDLKEHALTL